MNHYLLGRWDMGIFFFIFRQTKTSVDLKSFRIFFTNIFAMGLLFWYSPCTWTYARPRYFLSDFCLPGHFLSGFCLLGYFLSVFFISEIICLGVHHYFFEGRAYDVFKLSPPPTGALCSIFYFYHCHVDLFLFSVPPPLSSFTGDVLFAKPLSL